MVVRVLLVVALLAAPVLADPNMTRLRIEVRDHNDKPVEQASVVVRFVEGRSKIKLGKKIRTSWELKTSQEGIAKIPPIPQGKVLIQVNAKRHQTFGQVFEIDEEEKTVSIQLKAPQPQYSAHQ